MNPPPYETIVRAPRIDYSGAGGPQCHPAITTSYQRELHHSGGCDQEFKDRYEAAKTKLAECMKKQFIGGLEGAFAGALGGTGLALEGCPATLAAAPLCAAAVIGITSAAGAAIGVLKADCK
jgi:hypothetical protein